MSDSRPEHTSTYFVQDRSNQDEMTRLRIQDQMLTSMTGGVLPEQPDPTCFQRVLDVGCGTGGWLIATAKAYPTISLLIGVDINQKMVDYARSQAEAQDVSDRVEFHVMDALRMLEFPNAFFDLVNQRLGLSWLRTWEWPKMLAEYQRLTRQRGVIRITESAILSESSSPTLNQLYEMVVEAFYRSEHFSTPNHDAVTSQLTHLLHQYGGIQDVQAQAHVLEYQTGTPEWQSLYEDTRHFFRVLLPFLRKWASVPEDYETIYQRMLTEMQQPDFTATWHMLTAWGSPSPSASTPS